MKMRVINDYEYKGQIIELETGDRVRLGDRTDPGGPYPNWIHCVSERTGKAGWVDAGVLIIDGTIATANESYTSEEMTVSAGDIIDTIYELNGWVWCKRIIDSKEAWVDKGNLKELTKRADRS